MKSAVIKLTSLKPLPTPPQVKIPLKGGRPLKGLKKNTLVSPGQPLAEPACPGQGRPTASLPGQIIEIDQFQITLKYQPGASGHPPEPVELRGLAGPDLARRLTGMGLGIHPVTRPISRLVISAVDSEPGLALAETLWRDQQASLAAGLELARNLHPEAKGEPVTVAPAAIAAQVAWGPVETVRPRYPLGLKPLVKKRALRVEDPLGEGVFTLRELYLLGRLARTGLPLMDIPLTLLGANYLVPVGVTAGYLLLTSNHHLKPGEGVFLGGWFRGRAITDLERGLPPEAEALWTYRPQAFNWSDSCTGCRECRRVCPARLKPDLIAASARPDQISPANAVSLRPQLCFECALCSYHCPQGLAPSVWVKLAGTRQI